MRTTIDLSDEHRARLLELAARRGEKGFSGLVGEALEAYFRLEEERRARQRAVVELRGALSEEEAAELEERTRDLRRHWR